MVDTEEAKTVETEVETEPKGTPLPSPHQSPCRLASAEQIDLDSLSLSEAPTLNEKERATLLRRVLLQVEYYFSNGNLWNDETLRGEIDRHSERWVRLDFVASIQRVRELVQDAALLVEALQTSEHLEMSPELKHIRRRVALPPYNPKRDAKRCVYVDTLPPGSTVRSLKALFSRFGKVLRITPCMSLDIPGQPPTPVMETPMSPLIPAKPATETDTLSCVLIEFDSKTAAKQAVTQVSLFNNKYRHLAGRRYSSVSMPAGVGSMCSGRDSMSRYSFSGSPVNLPPQSPVQKTSGSRYSLQDFDLKDGNSLSAYRESEEPDCEEAEAVAADQDLPVAPTPRTAPGLTVTTLPLKPRRPSMLSADSPAFTPLSERIKSGSGSLTPFPNPVTSTRNDSVNSEGSLGRDSLEGTVGELESIMPAIKLPNVFKDIFVLAKYSYLNRLEKTQQLKAIAQAWAEGGNPGTAPPEENPTPRRKSTMPRQRNASESGGDARTPARVKGTRCQSTRLSQSSPSAAESGILEGGAAEGGVRDRSNSVNWRMDPQSSPSGGPVPRQSPSGGPVANSSNRSPRRSVGFEPDNRDPSKSPKSPAQEGGGDRHKEGKKRNERKQSKSKGGRSLMTPRDSQGAAVGAMDVMREMSKDGGEADTSNGSGGEKGGSGGRGNRGGRKKGERKQSQSRRDSRSQSITSPGRDRDRDRKESVNTPGRKESGRKESTSTPGRRGGGRKSSAAQTPNGRDGDGKDRDQDPAGTPGSDSRRPKLSLSKRGSLAPPGSRYSLGPESTGTGFGFAGRGRGSAPPGGVVTPALPAAGGGAPIKK